jgi:hypothetical protein
MTKIRTDYWPKPIPIRSFDWSATLEGYEPGGPIGTGATLTEAVHDLLMMLDREDEASRILPCKECTGVGGWSVESTHDPFTDRIGYHDIECPACAGAGKVEVESLTLEEEEVNTPEEGVGWICESSNSGLTGSTPTPGGWQRLVSRLDFWWRLGG